MTKHIRVLLAIVITVLASACKTPEKVTEPPAQSSAQPAPSADNTAVNTRDREGTTVTPTDQGGSEADLTITAKIRQAVGDDKTFSVNAQNIKIVTNAGKVTLRGPVKSQEEKKSIEMKAKQVAGVVNVDNQLEIESAR